MKVFLVILLLLSLRCVSCLPLPPPKPEEVTSTIRLAVKAVVGCEDSKKATTSSEKPKSSGSSSGSSMMLIDPGSPGGVFNWQKQSSKSFSKKKG